MLKLTEKVYLAAPFEQAEEQAFNLCLAELVRTYNFPLFMPQEALLALQAEGALKNGRLSEACMDVLGKANLVIAVFYGEEFDPRTAFEVGYALGRRVNVVAVQNNLYPTLARNTCSVLRLPSPQHCSRVVVLPEDPERLPDRLIPVLNRYFIPH